MKYYRINPANIVLFLSAWVFILLLILPAAAHAKKPLDLKPGAAKPGPIRSTAPSAPSPGTAPVVQAVDLKFENCRFHPTRAHAGSRITVSGRIKNNGIQNSGRYSIKIYLSRSGSIGTSDEPLVIIPGVTVGSKSARSFQGAFTIPENTPPVDHFAVAQIVQSGRNPVKDENKTRFSILRPPRPNLSIEIISFSPERPLKGERLSIHYKVKNTGNKSAATYGVELRLGRGCMSQHFASTQIRNVAQIGARQEKEHRSFITVPQTAPEGEAILSARVTAEEPETRTSDNRDCKEGVFIVGGGKPDLMFDLFQSTLSQSQRQGLRPGDRVPIKFRVKNDGTAASRPSILKLYLKKLSSSGAPMGIVRINLPALEPGASNPGSGFLARDFVIPEGVEPGRELIIGEIFNASGNTDLDTQNNKTAIQISIAEPPKPDLFISSFRFSQDNFYPGDNLNFIYTVKNIGRGEFSNPDLDPVTRYFISNDNRLDANDKAIGTYSNIAHLDYNHQRVSRVRASRALSGLTPGTYYLIIKADPDNLWDEKYETNNIGMLRFTVERRPATRPE